MREWISVKDRLPELSNKDFDERFSEDVLVYDPKEGILRAARHEDIGWWEESLGYNDGCQVLNPTHWMEMPEIPGGVKGEG